MTVDHKLALGVAAVLVAAVAVAGCGGGGESPTEVVLVTHDSFAISKPVKAGVRGARAG